MSENAPEPEVEPTEPDTPPFYPDPDTETDPTRPPEHPEPEEDDVDGDAKEEGQA